MQESEPTDLYEEVTQPQETTQEEVHLDTAVRVFHWMFFFISSIHEFSFI